MTRAPFTTRRIRLVGPLQRDAAINLLRNVPLDANKPLELVVREEVKARKPDQNALMWAGPLKDIEEQCYVEGRQFSAEVWHEWFKAQFLPDEFDPELTKDGYQKYAMTPDGGRVLVGSTTQLTVKGFAQYLTQIQAFGAHQGVQFHEPERVAA